MNLFGRRKPKESKAGKPARSSGAESFNRVQIFSRPEAVGGLLKGVREETVQAEVCRQKLKAASLVSGRGEALLHTYQVLKFKSGPRPVAVVGAPRSTKGGNFVPADAPLEAGETIEFSFSMSLPQAEGNTLYFTARGPYIQTAIYIPNAKDPSKPWVASREATEKKLGKGALRQGEEVLQVRVDQVTVYPNAPESYTADQIGPYVFSPKLYVISGGGAWTKRMGSGYFEGIPDDLTKHLEDLEKKEQLKTITGVTLIEFGVDQISMFVPAPLLAGVEHDNVLPSMRSKPNDNLQPLNSYLGFLLLFEINDDVKELLMRTFSQKVGKEVEVYLPLTLGHVAEADPPKERITFQIFPRDLVQDVGKSRRKDGLGLRFVPPFTLHPNPEDQNTYRKLMVALGQRMKDDSRPEEERNKLASVIGSVQQRREETKGKYVDENMRKAFLARQEARKRKDSQG